MKRVITLGLALFTLTAAGSAAAPPSGSITSVQFFHGSKRLVVSFHVPNGYRAYGIRLVWLVAGSPATTSTVSANPFASQSAASYVPRMTNTSWSIQLGDQGTNIGLGNSDYYAFLLYAPKWACHAVATSSGAKGFDCKHVQMSPRAQFHLGTIGTKSGPGTLVGQSSNSGIAAQGIVNGTVHFDPGTITVRVTGSSSDDSVHIDWVVTCQTAGYSIAQKSGGWDDTMPVNDSLSVVPPPGNMVSCDIMVSAAVTALDGGYVNLSVYASQD